VFVHDPKADAEEVMHEYGVCLLAWDDLPLADAIVAAVAHRQHRKFSAEDICRKLIKGGCFVDVKSGFSEAELRGNGLKVWRL
jgi:UDP-N-acetyl-D-glucosamine/UDP-N-acetyl-D-galactosamine dehydrogenase